MRKTLTVLALTAAALAQAPKKTATPKAPPTKEAIDAQGIRQNFLQVLDAVDASWFGKPYQGVNAVDISGNLTIAMGANAINAKVDEASKGLVKGNATKSGRATLQMKGTCFANGDFRTELAGDGGNLVYTWVGTKGYLYSRELNAYHTRVTPPASDAPLTYMGWFRQLVMEVKSAYVDGQGYKVSFGKSEGNLQTVIFHTETGTYDPKKREQSFDDTLGFWKRGHLEVTFDKTTKLPQRALFENVGQGVKAILDFKYGENNRLSAVNVTNQSRGMEGPGALRVSYSPDGMMNSFGGELNAKTGKIGWDVNLSWAKNRKATYMPPPPGTEKKGKEDMQAMLFVGLAGQIMDLQRHGLNLRSVTLPK